MKILLAEEGEYSELIKLVKLATMGHYRCDDPWYNCPKTGECADDDAGEECNCGADEHNEDVQKLAKKLAKKLGL